jgi:tetratricopeptide (TPR) repeat protein
MAKRPEDRFPTAHALAEAVESALAQPADQATSATAVLAAARGGNAAAVAGAGVPRPRTPRPTSQPTPSSPPPRERRAPRRAIAVAALGAAAVGVALAAGSTGNSPHGPGGSTAHAQRTVKHAVARPTAAKPKPRPKPQATQHTQTQQTQQTQSVTPAAATTTPPTADTLEAKGHALMEAGSYTSAIPVLRKALSVASPASLTYAYALFDLGHSLRLSGDPRAAVPILYKRLQIPNQTGVVRVELQAALRALGQQAQQQGGSVPAGPSGQGPAGPGAKPGHGHDGKDANSDLVTNQE